LIDYIGFDSHIDSPYNRNYQHLNWKPQITFDEVLQKNPDRWKYYIFKKFDTLEEADKCEYDLINLYRPRFNFKHGGVNGGKFYQDFEYNVIKAGKNGFCIRDRHHKTIIYSKDKDKLIPLAEGLNDGYLTEDDVKTINLNPFKYTVTKSGKEGFAIFGRDRKRLKRAKDKDKLEKVANALNNNVISEEQVKSTRGVDKLLKIILEA
jgi:hypothetical protein